MSKYDQVQCYMATGGIPYYISMLQKGKSLAQNIDRLFFESNAKLSLEFDRLYSSLFTNAENCKKIVRLLAQKQQGFTRKEITELTKMPDGGGLSATLKTLEVSDFIASYVKYGYPKREVYYRLTDFYSKFYLSFIDGKKTTNPRFGKTTCSLLPLQHGEGLLLSHFASITCHKSSKPLASVACRQKLLLGKVARKKMGHR